MRSPENEFVAQFIGSPVDEPDAGRDRGHGGRDHGEAGGRRASRGPRSRRSPPTWARRSSWAFAPRIWSRPTGDALFTGEVEITEALGEVTLLYFKRQGDAAQVVAKLPGIHADLRHKAVRLGADPRKIHLFMNGRSLRYR